MHARPRIVILTNVVAPYREEFYRRLCAEPSFEAHFLFWGHPGAGGVWPTEPPPGIRGERLPWHFLGGETVWNPTLMSQLRALQPDLLVCVGASTQSLAAWRCARSRRVPLMIWWGGTAESERNISGFKTWWRNKLFSRADAFFAYSSLAADNIRTLAGSHKPTYVLGNNTMDTKEWRKRVDQARARQPQTSGKPVILCVGQLIPRKNYSFAVDVFGGLQTSAGAAPELMLVGNGPERESLAQQAARLGIAGRVRFVGNVAHDQLPGLYAQARVFLHPATSDQWPQVVNESMAAGLPLMISRSSGVPEDVTCDGQNGFLLDAGDENAWRRCLQQVLTDDALAERMGRSAFETAAARDIEFALAEFKRGVGETLHRQ